MKNLIYLMFVGIIILKSVSLVAHGYCSITGYACSLQDLRNESLEQFNEFQNNINHYFTKNPLEKNYISKGFDIQHYHELFTFNTIV